MRGFSLIYNQFYDGTGGICLAEHNWAVIGSCDREYKQSPRLNLMVAIHVHFQERNTMFIDPLHMTLSKILFSFGLGFIVFFIFLPFRASRYQHFIER